MMKRALGLSVLLLAGCAADGSNNNTMVGGAVGGAAGAALGYEMGGRDGAVIGSAIGAATGAAVGSNQDAGRGQTRTLPVRRSRDESRREYVRGDDGGEGEPRRRHRRYRNGGGEED